MIDLRPLLIATLLVGCPPVSEDGGPDDSVPEDPTPDPTPSASESIDIGNYERLMEDVLFTRLGDDRGFGAEHDLARDGIVAEFEAAGLSVQLEPFQYYGDTYTNVVATQLGSSLPDEVIVVGAHFDSVDNPGADDNATGTAMVIELARALSGFELDRTVLYVAFDREEQGKVGSRAFVDAHEDEIVFAITADMVGQDHGEFGHDLFSTADSLPLVEGFASAMEEHGDGLVPLIQTGDQYTFSDHDSFERVGIPAFVIIEANYLGNEHYHRPTDAIDQWDGYIDYAFVEGLLQAAAEFVVAEAGAD
jgi:aminopeptidase YwaD